MHLILNKFFCFVLAFKIILNLKENIHLFRFLVFDFIRLIITRFISSNDFAYFFGFSNFTSLNNTERFHEYVPALLHLGLRFLDFIFVNLWLQSFPLDIEACFVSAIYKSSEVFFVNIELFTWKTLDYWFQTLLQRINFWYFKHFFACNCV